MPLGQSSPKAPSSVTQTNIPKYLKPYMENLAARSEALSYTPYTPYEGERIAGFTPAQEALQGQVLGMQTPEQFASATQGAEAAGKMGFGAGQQGLAQAFAYKPGQFSAGYRAQQYSPSGFSVQNVNAPGLAQYQMQGPGNVYAERAGSTYFTPGSAAYYMSPYQQQVSDIAAREVQRQADIQGANRTMQAIRGGTFGGSRQALMQSEADRNTQQQIGDIYTRGQQSAYESAQQQFERDQARQMAAQQLNIGSGLQAALANQGMGYQTGLANLQALLGVQQLGAGQNLQAQLANQQYGLTAQQLAEQSRQFGATFGESSAARAAQYAMMEQQAREQAAQYAAGLGRDIGLQGMQTGLASSQLLGQLGTAQQNADLARYQAQQQVAAQAQALEQQKLDLAYQDFQRQQQYPQDQLSFMSSIIRGLPAPVSTTTYQAPPSVASQLVGAGTALYGANKAGIFAKGGEVKNNYTSGLAGLKLHKVLSKG